jgi:NitT/TauT family transport system substrate-binding protein
MIRKLASLALATVLLASCTSAPKNEPQSTPGVPDKVTAGVIAILDVAPIYLGKQKGSSPSTTSISP